ncbi:MAG: dihydrodipicolinate synthase family protein [Chloroflexi bacterium]|nr:dihydrodipicolinate synthase family protein [Chloroflexota bacterium]
MPSELAIGSRYLRGVVPPLVTPFTSDGEVDCASLRRLCEFLIVAGVDGLYPCGTTGEFPLLSLDERRAVVETVVEAAAGRVPVFAHVGTASTREAVELARHAAAAGADGIGALTPYFYAYGDDDLARYYLELAEAIAPLPVYLYSLPSFARNTVSPELAAQLYRRAPNVVGLKDSSGDLDVLRAHRAVQVPGKAVSLLSGTDGLNLAALELGCDGMISGNANAAPEPFVALWRAWQSSNSVAARAAQAQIDAVRTVFANGARLADLKAVLVEHGILSTAVVRAPQPSAGDGGRLVSALEAAGVVESSQVLARSGA